MVVTGGTNSFWGTTNSFGTKHNNVETYFHHVVPDSHFFGSIDQIIAFVGYMHINKKAKKDLLIALENTKKNGYELKLGLTKDTLNSYAELNNLEIKKIVEFIKNNY